MNFINKSLDTCIQYNIDKCGPSFGCTLHIDVMFSPISHLPVYVAEYHFVASYTQNAYVENLA